MDHCAGILQTFGDLNQIQLFAVTQQLSGSDRHNLLRRVVIKPDAPTIDQIESELEKHLLILPAAQRPIVAQRLIEWWDRQIVYSLCGKRERVIAHRPDPVEG